MQSIVSRLIEIHAAQPRNRPPPCTRGMLERWSGALLVSSLRPLLSLGIRFGAYIGLGLLLASQSVLGQVFSQRPIAREQTAGTNSTTPVPRIDPVVDLSPVSQVER